MAAILSELHATFINFAKGMPAVAISWIQIERDLDLLRQSLKGINPAQPSPYMGDIRMPVHGLAYSAFVDLLEIKPGGNRAELRVRLTANVHPAKRPDEVIRSYLIEVIDSPALLALQLDDANNEVFWQQQGSSIPKISPNWGPNADDILAATSIPDPKRDKYLEEVERQIIWLTGPSFVRLVADILPRYSLSEIVPWLRLRPPLRANLASPHIVLTSSRATITIGDCSPQTINIEPDPDFPYGQIPPAPSKKSDEIDIAVYAPRTRLVEFFAKKIDPAILVSDSGGGSIKWQLAGSVGLKGLVVDLVTAQGPSGVLYIQALLDLLGVCRAWVDGPSGARLSLVSASVLGSGDLTADVQMRIDVSGGFIEAVMAVTRCDLSTVDWDVSTPAPWPLNVIAREIFNRISRDQARKLEGTVTRIGKWDILGLPTQYLDTIERFAAPAAYSEGLAGVSALVAVTRKNIGRRLPNNSET